jgi:hypothetical protein
LLRNRRLAAASLSRATPGRNYLPDYETGRLQSRLSIGRTGDGSSTRWAVYQGARRIHGGLPDAETASWARDLYYLDVAATDPRWEELGWKRVLGHGDCIDHDRARGNCATAVEYRGEPHSEPGRVPRCERHWLTVQATAPGRAGHSAD